MVIKAILNRRFKKEPISSNSEKMTESLPRLQLRNSIEKLRQQFHPSKVDKQEIEAGIEQISHKLKGIGQEKMQAIFHRFALAAKPETIEKLVQKLPKMNRGPVKQIWGHIQALLQMIRDPEIAWASKALAIGALLYLISPLDAIPDVIPLAGLTDDVALIIAVVSTLAYQLGNYVEKSANKGVEIASEVADIQVRKYNKIVRVSLIGSILAAILTIVVQFVLKQIG